MDLKSKPPREPSLARGDFTRGELRHREQLHIQTTFGEPRWERLDNGRFQQSGGLALVDHLIEMIGDGKEATVYQCRATDALPVRFCAAKVYRAQSFRAFAKAGDYLADEHRRDRRAQKAIRQHSKRGRAMVHHDWIEREWRTLSDLYDAGARIPQPFAHTDVAILMAFIGDERGAAPLLKNVQLSRGDAARAFEQIVDTVRTMLDHDRIHGDLSPYNILYWDDEPIVC